MMELAYGCQIKC